MATVDEMLDLCALVCCHLTFVPPVPEFYHFENTATGQGKEPSLFTADAGGIVMSPPGALCATCGLMFLGVNMRRLKTSRSVCPKQCIHNFAICPSCIVQPSLAEVALAKCCVALDRKR